MKRGTIIIGLLLIPFLVCNCIAPKTFKKGSDPAWQQIILKPALPYDVAWNILIDALTEKYIIEVSDKESGYIKTGWCYTTTGVEKKHYKCRVIVRFRPNKRSLQVKTECEFQTFWDWVFKNKWSLGTDSRATEDVYLDLKSKVGQK